MGRITKLRKCSLLLFLLIATTAAGATAPLPKLPVIQQVGVIPVQWEGENVTAGRAAIDSTFAQIVRDSRRFRVLNDDLISQTWNTPEGRQELKDQFELQGFVSLTVTPRSDTVRLTARLMDGNLKSNLLESDTVTVDWLANAQDAAVRDRLERLVFRLFNRIPVDVSVTSVQGSYITLSGGSDQGIEAGDKVDLVRAEIKSLHPANGTWLDFQKQNLGTAQVVEVKTYTSVAKLTGQTYDNAVQVSDGARIGAIASRVKFARLAQNDGFKDSGNQDTIVVPPLYNGAPPPKPQAPVKQPLNAPNQPPPTYQQQPQYSQQAPEDSAVAPQAAPQSQPQTQQAQGDQGSQQEPAVSPAEDNGPTLWDDVASDATSHKLVDDITAHVGPHWWSVRGPTNQSGKFPIWLLNSIGGGITRTMLFKFKTAFGGGLLFGKTNDGTYMGYDSYAKLYWEDVIATTGFLRGWRAGGIATFSGMGMKDGDYGGGDWVRGGFYGGLFGTVGAGEGGQLYDWFGTFAIMPLNIGRIGYAGGRKVVESAFGTKFELGAYQHQPPRIIQWGGGIEIGDERQTLKNGRRPHFKTYQLNVLAKYVL